MAKARTRYTMPLVFVLATLAAGAARADVIDGDWCFEGKHFSIRGPMIVTPEGVKMEGSYTRHSFSYVVPAPAAEAGVTIYMRLMNEMNLRLAHGSDPDQATQVWKRCEVTS
jgi:hypothetical protein